VFILKKSNGFPDQRLVEPSVVRRQSLGIGRKSAFDALWDTGGTGGGSPRVVPLSAGTLQSDKRSWFRPEAGLGAIRALASMIFD
jgi:hypothetical protein